MKTKRATQAARLALLLAIAPVPALAQQLTLDSDGAIRLQGLAGGSRSVWARGRSLALALSSTAEVSAERLKLEHPDLIDARLQSRGSGRIELQLRLRDAAEKLLPRLALEEDGRDLVVRVTPALPPSLRSPRPTSADLTKPKTSIPTATERVSAVTSPPGEVAPRGVPGTPSVAQGTAAAPSAASGSKAPPWLAKERSGSGNNFAVGLMLALLAGFAGWQWWRRRRAPVGGRQNQIGLLDARSLSTRHKLVLVEVGGEALLLGCTDKEIRVLRRVSARREPGAQEGTRAPSLPLEHALGRLSRDDELSAAAELLEQRGDRDEVAISTGSSGAPPSAPGQLDATRRSRFVEALSQQLQLRQQQAPRPIEPAGRALDESWAEGILRLRRAQRAARPGDNRNAMH